MDWTMVALVGIGALVLIFVIRLVAGIFFARAAPWLRAPAVVVYPMNPWTFWWELWRRASLAMVPFEAMAAASAVPPAREEPDEAPEVHKEDFLVSRLRTELEVKGPQGIIDEGGGG